MQIPRKVLTLGVITGLVVTASSLSPARGATTGWAPPTGGCWDEKPAERDFAAKINSARVAGNASRLRLDPQLSRSARKHTWEMVLSGSLHHTPEPALRRRVTNWTVLGENVGVGTSVDSLQRAFMSSPLHRDNILYPTFRHVGVGVVERNNRMWVTVIFEAHTDPGTTLRMPACD